MNRIEVKQRNGRKRGSLLGFLVILLLWGPMPMSVFAQEVGQIKTKEGVPINFTYKSWDILNYQQPNETHLISGDPARATVEMEQGTIRLQADYLAYYNAGAIIEATDGIIISDGTLTIDANHGEYDIKEQQARFLKGVKWESTAGGRTSSGSMEYIYVEMGDEGIENIRMGGKPGNPSKMNLSGNPEIFGDMMSGAGEKKNPEGETEEPAMPEEKEEAAQEPSLIPAIEKRATSGLAR